MDFDLSEEQQLLKDSVERLLHDHYGFEDRRRYLGEKAGFSERMWDRYAELGLLALPFPEAHGGVGAGAIETMIVMEAFGKALLVEPYFATVVLAGGVLRRAASESQKARLIPAIAQGRMKLALAYAEAGSRYDLFHVETRATRDGEGWMLNGAKSLVLHGDVADKLIVTARSEGAHCDPQGIGLYLVDGRAKGLTRRGYPTQNGLRAAELVLDAVRVEAADLIGEAANASQVIARVADEAIAASCAEAVGCFAQMHALTLDYLKSRRQFGTTLGSFQVLQHRAVDMFVELEQSRSMALYATMMVDAEEPIARARAMSAAKRQICESSKLIAHQAIQLHGGNGMTMAYSVGHYFKHVTMIDAMLGDAGHHLRRLAAMGGLEGEEADARIGSRT